ncbi:MAG: tRNA threonylcarbamoyladenosine biosynthesis protein TsaE [uncultured Friedmanniella sp.]|uniref:tRNA threonylcarbamoyladenosine biosynthesis protein TsaE n=1 Tax=uncultured Friedmanniella sp. TaxID=335381 RepID=A0A6J4JR78_9ACTN|nr:MAG: tRNA threonylcarbamoyladenosine biosynthesis protein TsaE [uncultured Friedmanniella sp.]
MSGWSRVVAGPAEVPAVLADPGDALDVRLPGRLEEATTRIGAVEVVPGELAVPVPQSLADLAATRRLGARLAAGLRAGDLVVLSGPLGAGKTSLTQGIGAALGVRGAVTSPTFVLARTHRGSLPLVHVDAYRLREAGARLELDDLDLDAALEDAVTVVEWGEGLAERLTDSWVEVRLDRTAAQGRSARVVCRGPRWAAGVAEG